MHITVSCQEFSSSSDEWYVMPCRNRPQDILIFVIAIINELSSADKYVSQRVIARTETMKRTEIKCWPYEWTVNFMYILVWISPKCNVSKRNTLIYIYLPLEEMTKISRLVLAWKGSYREPLWFAMLLTVLSRWLITLIQCEMFPLFNTRQQGVIFNHLWLT